MYPGYDDYDNGEKAEQLGDSTDMTHLSPPHVFHEGTLYRWTGLLSLLDLRAGSLLEELVEAEGLQAGTGGMDGMLQAGTGGVDALLGVWLQGCRLGHNNMFLLLRIK